MATPRPYQNLTIGDMADRAVDGWLWAHCSLPCMTAVAVPVAYFLNRYGPQEPAETIFQNLSCPKCGGHPSTFTLPSYAGSPTDPKTLATIPWDLVPKPIRVAMGR